MQSSSPPIRARAYHDVNAPVVQILETVGKQKERDSRRKKHLTGGISVQRGITANETTVIHLVQDALKPYHADRNTHVVLKRIVLLR